MLDVYQMNSEIIFTNTLKCLYEIHISLILREETDTLQFFTSLVRIHNTLKQKISFN